MSINAPDLTPPDAEDAADGAPAGGGRARLTPVFGASAAARAA